MQLCRQNNQSDNSKVFSAYGSSKKAFDNIFGNTVLLKFQNFALKPEVCQMGGHFRLQNGLNLLCRYGLVVNVQKDACFGLSCTLCTIFKICSLFSEIATFKKFVKILSRQKMQLFQFFFFFFLFFSVWCTTVFTCTR